MKKIAALLAVMLVVLMSVTAMAEGSLNDKLAGLLNAAESTGTDAPAAQEAAPAAGSNVGLDVAIDDAFFEKVRSSAFLYEGKYSKEMNVFVELKNVSGKTLYPDDATVTILDASGNELGVEDYAYVYPKMVENGGSFFVWEWIYSPDYELSSVGSFAVKVESETDSYTEYAKVDATGSVADGIVAAKVANTTDAPMYGISTVMVITGENGEILDVCQASTGNAIGIEPGSTMVLRSNATDHANDEYLTGGDVTVYALYELD